MEDIIEINKYLYFDKDSGRFTLTSEAREIIYRQKHVICSYSGTDEWCNHFVCELIDLYSGSSIYNYAIGCCKHEKEIPEIFATNREGLCEWIEKIIKKEWGKKLFDMFVAIIDDLPMKDY